MDNTLTIVTAIIYANKQFVRCDTREEAIAMAKAAAEQLIKQCAPPIVVPEGAKKFRPKVAKKKGWRDRQEEE